MVGGVLEQLGAALLGPVVAIHNAIASDEQKAEYQETGEFPPAYLIGGTLVVGVLALYVLAKAKVIKPAWATKTVTRYRAKAGAARTYYRRRRK